MNDLDLLRDLALIWGSALISGHLFHRLRLPVAAGYMLAGVIVGPHGFKLISQSEQIRVLSEFGVAMLLFALGVDISLKQILSSAGRVVAVGVTQIFLTLFVCWGLSLITGKTTNVAEGFLFGSVCAISSSVIISKTLMERGELDSIHGRLLVAVSLIQDLSLVFIMPFLPLLQNSAGQQLGGFIWPAVKAVVFILVAVFGAVRLIPWLLSHAAKTDSREIFLLSLLVLCLAIALVSQWLGLSLALGAFLAGLMMCESVYAHQALQDVSPLRDLFSTIFFVSVGMLLNPSFVADHLFEVATFVSTLILVKALLGTLAARCAVRNWRSAVLVGVGLSQIGEFSFVLLTMGYHSHLISEPIYNLFFAGAVVSMIASPALMDVVQRIMLRLSGLKTVSDFSAASPYEHLSNHVIVCGFGRIGRNLGQVMQSFQIPFVVVELNAAIIEDLAVRGIPHIYGDAMSQSVLAKVQLREAAVIVLTMPDPLSAEAVASYARAQNPHIKIVARAHRSQDIAPFQRAGVNAVVQPEFEASIEITRLVLHGLKRTGGEVLRALNGIKTRRYALFQPDIDNPEPGLQLEIGDDQMGIWYVIIGRSLNGKTISDLNVRGATGATITSVKRGETTVAFPAAQFMLETADWIYAVGNCSQLRRLEERFGLARADGGARG